jgi:hypothetical protein
MNVPFQAIKSQLRHLKRHIFKQPIPESPWKEILERSQPFLEKYVRPSSRIKVLGATSVGSHAAARVIDSLVGSAMWLRGADVTMLLCDHALPACERAMYVDFPWLREFAKHGPRKSLCDTCFSSGSAYYRPLPFPTVTYGKYLSEGTQAAALRMAEGFSIEDCFGYEDEGMALGEQARAGVLRFFGKATFEQEDPKFVLAVARRYLAGAVTSARAAEAAIKALKPDVVVGHHGVYVPQGVIGAVARKLGVQVVNWGPSYRNTTVIYSHGDTYHHTFMDEPVRHWESYELGESRTKALMEYLEQRRGGKGDWSWVTPDRGDNALVEEHSRILRELGLDPAKPSFGLLTNVLWDAQLYYDGRAFDNMLDWLFTTIDWFIANPDVQLVIRVHPHEVKGGNRQPTGPEIRRRYPDLPTNIKLVDRASAYSTYALMDLCQAVLIYGTKTGVELAPYGTPIVVAGEAWIRGKGISIDITDRLQYLALLKDLPSVKKLDEPTILRARRYAYHYFFRRMIPLASIDPEGGADMKMRIREISDLLPTRDPGLDVICSGIMTGADFIYDPAA